jgi:DNA-binding response OmpR family regulator
MPHKCIIRKVLSMKKGETTSNKDSAFISTEASVNPPCRILVVNDDHDRCQLTVDVLVSSGYEVDAAVNGAAGWEALKANHYDLLITDNKMPKMTGVELIEKVRLTRVGLPVIMATSSLPQNVFVHKPWLKPDALLQWPFTNDDLLATVKGVMRTDDANKSHIEMLLPKYL